MHKPVAGGAVLLAVVLAGTAACGLLQPARAQTPGRAAARDSYAGHLALTPDSGSVGSHVTVTGTGLPADTSFHLVWQGLEGHWVLKGKRHEDYAGRAFRTVDEVLAQVRSSPGGDLRATFTVPPGFGFGHTVELMEGGQVRNQALFEVRPRAWLAAGHGPEGSPIRITLTGIGARSYTNNWMLLYDNRFTGWISSVTTGGTAHVRIPATGGPGRHVISIIHGAYTFPYLNTEQSPHPKPEFHLIYTVTAGSAVQPRPLAKQGLAPAPGRAPAGRGRAAWVSPATGPVQAPLAVHARGLPAGAPVTLDWETVAGSRVTPAGWSEKTVALTDGVVGANGSVVLRVAAPDDVGGAHAIRIVGAGGKNLVSTTYTLTPTAVRISPTSGPDGTAFTLQLNGVGWTDTANIYTVDYDNAYMGYACGFNSHGDVTIHLVASGKPGWHYVDLYPSIYKGHDIKGTDDFRLPQLTFNPDHPGEKLPAFHFAFDVTAG